MIGASPEQQSLDRPILSPGQLIVEGRGPEMVFREMVSHLGIQLDVRTFGEANKRNLQTWLELFCQKAAFKERVVRIGIVRDAEATNAVRAFQSVQSSLSAAKLAVPNKMNAVEGSPLGVGVFILPNCHDDGMLESLCLSAIEEVDHATQRQFIRVSMNSLLALRSAIESRPIRLNHVLLHTYWLQM